jgi:hypothetical protein
MRVVRARRLRTVTTALLNRAALLGVIAWLASQLGSRAQAQAEAKVLDLAWNAPSTCLSESAARAEVAQLIRSERSAAESARARVLIKGSEQTGYVAEIEVERGATSGERTLRGRSCDDLSEAAVLIIAMAIDPEGASARAAARAASKPVEATPPVEQAQPAQNKDQPAQAEQTSESKPEASEQTESEEAEEEPEEEELDEPSDPRAGRVALGVLGSGDVGSLPHATLAGGLIAGLHWPRLRLELQALAYLPQVERSGPTLASNAKIGLYTASISGCYDVLGARDEARALGGCALLEGGLSQGESHAISNSGSSQGLWLAGFTGLDVRQRVVGPLQLRLFAGVGLPILRPAYEIDPFGRVFRASPVLGRFGISAFVLFP